MPVKKITKKNKSKRKTVLGAKKAAKTVKRKTAAGANKVTKKVVKPKAKAKRILKKASHKKSLGKKLGKKQLKKKVTKKISRKPAAKKTVRKKKIGKTAKPAAAKGSGVAKKKTVVRKTASSRKKRSKKVLITVSAEQCFWINNGPILSNLRDLYNALKNISKDQFVFHAHGDSNDFALWVEYVLLDKKCAKVIKKAKTQKTATKKVSEILKKYQ